MPDAAGNSNIRAAAVQAAVEPADPASRVVKDVASVVDAQVAAPATPAYEGPGASCPVGPHRAG